MIYHITIFLSFYSNAPKASSQELAQNTGGCAGIIQHVEIKRNPQLNSSCQYYGAEAWTGKKVHEDQLQTFEMMWLPKDLRNHSNA